MNGRKWEYKIETIGIMLGNWELDKLNKMGDEGWEAVGLFYGEKKGQMYILFKREKVIVQTVVVSPPSPQPAATPTCPTCSQPLAFIQQYGRWYCYHCKKYP